MRFTLHGRYKYLPLIGSAALIAAVVFLLLWLGPDDLPVDKEDIRDFLEKARGTPWALPLICALYVGGGFILFPVTVLNLAAAMVFGAVWGVIYALIGALLSAAVFFGIGHGLGDKYLRKYIGGKVKTIDEKISESGIIGLTMLRYVPMAPYSVFNVMAGISSVTFPVFMLATFFSLVPGAIARGIVGDSLMQMVLDPTQETLFWLIGGVSLWIAIVAGAHFTVKKFQKD